jgi:hypothetical protein
VEAQCECGEKRFFNFREMRAGRIISCGCGAKNRWKKYINDIGLNCTGAEHPQWKGKGKISGGAWASWKKSARDRNIPFVVTIEDGWSLYEQQGGLCALSGVPIAFATQASKQRQKTASLDRIDSSKGYVLENIQWVHKQINYMKGKMLLPELVEWCKAITSTQGGKMLFDDRRQIDPQGIIDDLLAQISRQAVAIYEKNVKLAKPPGTQLWLSSFLTDTKDGIEPLGQDAMGKKIKPRTKTRAKKADKQPDLIPDFGGEPHGNL